MADEDKNAMKGGTVTVVETKTITTTIGKAISEMVFKAQQTMEVKDKDETEKLEKLI